MFFPGSPDFVADLLDVSVSTLLLGKRVDASEGNGHLYRYLNRLRSNELTRTSVEQLFQLFTAIVERHPILRLPFIQKDQSIVLEVSDPWQAFALGAKLDTTWPRTVNLIKQFYASSRRIELKFEMGQHTYAIECLKQLPWQSADTVRWYVDECERDPSNAVAASFPLKFLSLLAVMKGLGEEQRKLGDNKRGILTPLITSRDPSTGELIALRVWLDQVQQASGLASQDAMFKIILRDFGADDGTRIRQGRKYRSPKFDSKAAKRLISLRRVSPLCDYGTAFRQVLAGSGC